jgi:hypothetical protein
VLNATRRKSLGRRSTAPARANSDFEAGACGNIPIAIPSAGIGIGHISPVARDRPV